jgi:hypothetical protein
MSLTIKPSHSAYSPSDDRWLTQVNLLLGDLKSGGGDVERKVTPVPGQKGGIETIILALGTSGVITASVEIIKAWLARDKKRSLELAIDRDGKKETVSVSGTVDTTTLTKFMEKALKR